MNREQEITPSSGETEVTKLKEQFPVGTVFQADETIGMIETWTIDGYETHPDGNTVRIKKKQASKFTYKRIRALSETRQHRINESVVEMTPDEFREVIKNKPILDQER